MSSRSASYKPSASFADVKKRERNTKKIKRTGGIFAGMHIRPELNAVLSEKPLRIVNWKIKSDVSKVVEWKPTGTYNSLNGKEKHTPNTHIFSWFLRDRNGVWHLGSRSTHYILRWEDMYTSPGFPSQSKEEVERLITTPRRDVRSAEVTKSESNHESDGTPSFLEERKTVEPDQWQVYEHSDKSIHLSAHGLDIRVHWWSDFRGKWVGDSTVAYRLRPRKRAYYMTGNEKTPIQTDYEIMRLLMLLSKK